MHRAKAKHALEISNTELSLNFFQAVLTSVLPCAFDKWSLCW